MAHPTASGEAQPAEESATTEAQVLVGGDFSDNEDGSTEPHEDSDKENKSEGSESTDPDYQPGEVEQSEPEQSESDEPLDDAEIEQMSEPEDLKVTPEVDRVETKKSCCVLNRENIKTFWDENGEEVLHIMGILILAYLCYMVRQHSSCIEEFLMRYVNKIGEIFKSLGIQNPLGEAPEPAIPTEQLQEPEVSFEPVPPEEPVHVET